MIANRVPVLADAGATLRRPLTVGVLVSLALHVLLLSMSFAPPRPPMPAEAAMAVVLLEPPPPRPAIEPRLRAQQDASGGGQGVGAHAPSAGQDAPSVLPGEARSVADVAAPDPAPGDTPGFAARSRSVRVTNTDQREAAIMASSAVDAANPHAGTVRVSRPVSPTAADAGAGSDPGVDAAGVAHALYVDRWATQVERLGTRLFPSDGRGRLYGQVRVVVDIDRHGAVVRILLEQPSQHRALNEAVRRIVMAGAPYDRFSPEMVREGDVIRIKRTWNFTNDSLATESAAGGR